MGPCSGSSHSSLPCASTRKNLHLEEGRILAGEPQDALLRLQVAVGQIDLGQGREAHELALDEREGLLQLARLALDQEELFFSHLLQLGAEAPVDQGHAGGPHAEQADEGEGDGELGAQGHRVRLFSHPRALRESFRPSARVSGNRLTRPQGCGRAPSSHHEKDRKSLRILINAAAATFGGPLSTVGPLLATLPQVDGGRHTYGVVARSDIAEKIDPHHDRVRMWARWEGASRRRRILQEQILLPMRAMTAARVGRRAVDLQPGGHGLSGAAGHDVPERRPLHAVRHPAARAEPVGLAAAGPPKAQPGRRARRRPGHLRFGEPAQHHPPAAARARRSKTARIYLSFPRAFRPEAAERANEVLPRYGLKAPYIVCVSALLPVQEPARAHQGLRAGGAAAPAGGHLGLRRRRGRQAVHA